MGPRGGRPSQGLTVGPSARRRGPAGRRLAAYISAVRALGGHDRASVMAGVVAALADATGWPAPPALEVGDRDVAPDPAVAAITVPTALVDSALLGLVHQALLQPADRHRHGAHYTPAAIARRFLDWATAGLERPLQAVCDPAVGGGAFLLAAADRLLRDGGDPAAVVRSRLWGIDIDPLAVAVSDAALACWAWCAGDRTGARPGNHLAIGDSLHDGPDLWPAPASHAFDLVVGNPPFQGQLGRDTARTPDESAALRRRLGPAVAAYADTAALFLLVARAMTAPGGKVAMVQPLGTFATRDAAGVRAAILQDSSLDGVWVAGTAVFEAQVRVGAVVLQADGGPGRAARRSVRRAAGPDFTPLPPVDVDRAVLREALSWSHLIAAANGTPAVRLEPCGRLGDLATATAGFRHQFYGLVPYVVEAAADDDRPRLVTSGLIDPVDCRWGRVPARFAGRSWTRPVVDLAALSRGDPALARWVERVAKPKVMVAAQTRVVEAVVDADGVAVPSVPVVAVHPAGDALWAVAAVLHAPGVSAWALHRAGGSALAADAVKLSARQVLEVPLPSDRGAWDDGAALLERSGCTAAFAGAMNRAYGLPPDHPVATWWLGRQPQRTGRPAATSVG